MRVVHPSEERFNTASHAIGAALAAAGAVVLITPAVRDGDLARATGFAIYGGSLLLAFLASTLYHGARGSARRFWRRCDRSAIYLLIAGTYTPIVLLRLDPAWGRPVLVLVWLLALWGSLLEFLPRKRAPRSVALYMVMGWMACVTIKPLWDALSPWGVAYLIAGGILFTVGGIAERTSLLPRSHEIWHVLAMAGSACHFVMMLYYVA